MEGEGPYQKLIKYVPNVRFSRVEGFWRLQSFNWITLDIKPRYLRGNTQYSSCYSLRKPLTTETTVTTHSSTLSLIGNNTDMTS